MIEEEEGFDDEEEMRQTQGKLINVCESHTISLLSSSNEYALYCQDFNKQPCNAIAIDIYGNVINLVG